MNKILQEVFKYAKVDTQKLAPFGFKRQNGIYVYEKSIVGGAMKLTVRIDESGSIDTVVTDADTNEEYALFLADDAAGSFVGQVREEYTQVTATIAERCCVRQVFKSEYANLLIKYVEETYGDSPEYLWEKFPDNAIWRRNDNKKWYGLILTARGDRVGLDSSEKVELIDVRANPDEIDSLIDGKSIFQGYHMNKKHWISMRLDGSFDFDAICKLLDTSRRLALKK